MEVPISPAVTEGCIARFRSQIGALDEANRGGAYVDESGRELAGFGRLARLVRLQTCIDPFFG